MKIREWLAIRGPAYVYKRARALLDRYDATPSKAMDRIQSCMATLAEYGCAPTFPTPGRVVQRHPQFLRQLQGMGAEIAVHSYDHVDLAAYPPAEASQQLLRAAEVFAQHRIEAHGFRCPYLSCTDGLLDALPKGMFDYSSNKAIRWDVPPSTGAYETNPSVDVLHRLYKPASALDTVCAPWTRPNMVEIPVCLPDDLELHDGLGLGPEGITQAWSQILHGTHQRGELFALLFHPELAWRHREPFIAVLEEARRLDPPVWIARLRDVSDWWREKSDFSIAVSPVPDGLHISFNCSERATILIRGLGSYGSAGMWDGVYYQLQTRALDVPPGPRPFVGLAANAPRHVVHFLQEQGYILDTGDTAKQCGTYIDAATLVGLTSEVRLVHYIEAFTGPLVRYWRWPDGAKSAMCVTGDLDALTLLDYASRLFAR